jgi:hypothetical protein
MCMCWHSLRPRRTLFTARCVCACDAGNGCAGNLEGIHNTWHQAVGNDVRLYSWSGFDPLFWWVCLCRQRQSRRGKP